MKRLFLAIIASLLLFLPAAMAQSFDEAVSSLNKSEIIGSKLQFPLTTVMSTETVGVNISTETGDMLFTVITQKDEITDFKKGEFPENPTMTVETSSSVLESIFSSEDQTNALFDAIENDDIMIKKNSAIKNIWLGFLINIVIPVIDWFV